MFSKKNKTPKIDAKITLRKSKGITIVDLDILSPSIVKNCASKPNIVINIIKIKEKIEGSLAKNI